MSETGYQGADTRPWKIYTSSDQLPPEANRGNAPWKSLGSTSSMNAVSFGFVATALLISMFLIMAILEHLFRPTGNSDSSSLPNNTARYRDRDRDHGSVYGNVLETGAGSASAKLRSQQQQALRASAVGLSVLMPGQKYPTCIAQPAPLPCSREPIHWPSHET